MNLFRDINVLLHCRLTFYIKISSQAKLNNFSIIPSVLVKIVLLYELHTYEVLFFQMKTVTNK